MAKRGRPPQVENRPDADAIEADLLTPGANFSQIQRKYGISRAALDSFRAKRIKKPVQDMLDSLAERSRGTSDLDVLARLMGLMDKAQDMLDAAHDWLRDPVDPRKLNLDPRSSEVWVIWQPHGGARREKARLSELLERVEGIALEYVRKDAVLAHLAPYDEAREALAYLTHAGPPLPVRSEIDMRLTEAKVSDPRQLLLKAIDSLKPVLELLGKATGQLKAEPVVQVNVLAVRRQVELVAKELGVSADELMGKTEEFAVMLEKREGK